jgi:REP element-mobilizing transposase RayT
MKQMLLGYHFIISAYGFWLPNDSRGSWSDVVRQFELLRYGPATKVSTTKSVAAAKHDRSLREKAKLALKYPPVCFTGQQAVRIAKGFGVAKSQHDYEIHALAILPDHVHMVMRAHDSIQPDQIAAHLKAKATAELNMNGQHPLAENVSASGRIPSPWGRNYWKVFIFEEDHYRQAIRYVELNPVKAGLKPQKWSIVTPYSGARDKSRR